MLAKTKILLRCMKRLTCIIIALLNMPVCAQTYEWKIQVLNTNSSPVAGALLWSSNFDTVFYTNTQGFVRLKADEYISTINVQKPGYTGQSAKLVPNQDTVLVKLNKELATAGISAEHLMNKIYDSFTQHQIKYKAYQTKTFMRSEAIIEKTPLEIWGVSGILIPGERNIGKVYTGESWREQKYLNRYHYSERVVGKREGGSVAAENWQLLPAYDWSLYNRKIYFNNIFDRGFYSPLSPENSRFYKFKIEGSYTIANHLVYRLTFRPDNELAPLFTGTVDIIDSLWLPLQSEFYVPSSSPLELLDSVQVLQSFHFANGEYKKARERVNFTLVVLGLKSHYIIDQFHYNFSFSDTLKPKDFNTWVYHQPQDAFERDSTFWVKRTPAVLDDLGNFKDGENFQSQLPYWQFYKNSKLSTVPPNYHSWLYKGHLFRFGHFYIGKPPPLFTLGFNPVEGSYLKYSFPLGYSTSEYNLELAPTFRYGFADNAIKSSARLSLNFDPESPKVLELAGGRQYRQFNTDEPILPVVNSLYSLFLGENLIKLFGRDFIEAKFAFELVDALSVNTSLEYARRFPLYNRSNFSFLDTDNIYEPNNQFTSVSPPAALILEHNALNFGLGLSYQIGQLHEYRYKQYRQIYQIKKNIFIEKPRLYYNLRLGIKSEFSATDFLFQNIGINYYFRIDNAGTSRLDVSAGHFLYKNFVPFTDFKHFDGVQLFFLQPTPSSRNRLKQFGTLPYYGFSTTQAFLELHYEHFFEGYLLEGLRPLRQAHIHLLTGTNALVLADGNYFIEGVIGFSNLLKVLRIEYTAGTGRAISLQHTLRFSFDLDYLYFRNNRIR